ncbi:MAG: wax ester/triacylglycerol synthase family O-acyltransferase [Dehalococcoidia bacterium]
MSPTQLSRRMSAEDAWFLYFEKPDAALHIGSVGIFEGAIPFADLHACMDARMHLIPRYRQRPIIPPLFAGHPTWEDDPNFSLDRHLHEVELPAPGTHEQLIELSSELFAKMLPRDRPLWDITVIHGLEGGRTAYLNRVHHCLVDGVSGIELLLAIMDLTPDPDPPVAGPEWQPKTPPNAIESWAEAMFEQWNQNFRAFTEWQENLLDPRAQMRQMTEMTRAFEVALPLLFRQPQRMIWNKPVSGNRLAAWTHVSFQEVRRIRGALGGTVNDVVLTLLGGALGHYLRSRDVNTQGMSVRVQIPVNVRNEDQKGALGNRVSMMLPEIPVGAMSPQARLKAVREEVERRKTREEARAFESLLRISENLPAAYHALAGMGGVPQGSLNLVCTNVPGPLIPLYSVGHRMVAHYPMVPLAGDLGIGVGVTSFDQGLYIGIMCDPKILSDVGRIADYFDQEFRELRALAGVEESDVPDFGAIRNGHSTEAPPAPAATPEPAPAPAS